MGWIQFNKHSINELLASILDRAVIFLSLLTWKKLVSVNSASCFEAV